MARALFSKKEKKKDKTSSKVRNFDSEPSSAASHSLTTKKLCLRLFLSTISAPPSDFLWNCTRFDATSGADQQVLQSLWLGRGLIGRRRGCHCVKVLSLFEQKTLQEEHEVAAGSTSVP